MGKKDLTSRQQMEILSYALERAEDNIRRSVDALENERKKIEIFKVDTAGIEKVYKDASEHLDKLSSKRIAEMKELHREKPKWLHIKDVLLIGSLFLLFVISAGFSVSSYYKQSKLEEENAKLNNIVNNLSNFFGEHPKEAKVFEEWNK